MRVAVGKATVVLVLTAIASTISACDEKECDRRQFDDRKEADDFCWAPPHNYCSQGASGAITEACDPTKGICCTYVSTCIPCDFVNCNKCTGQREPGPDCPEACSGAHSSDPEACKQPDPDQIICYEEK